MTPKEIATHTLEILDQKRYTNAEGIEIDLSEKIDFCLNNTKFFSSSDLEIILNNINENHHHSTSINIEVCSSVQKIIQLRQTDQDSIITCLNFASAKNPGGGFINGAVAQEESIARSSALYASQLTAPSFYSLHRSLKSCVYTDSMIFSPNTPVFKNDKCLLLSQPILCNFITSAAVNAGVVRRIENIQDDEIENLMRVRIKKMFALAHSYHTDILILGAWGCGVFQNNPAMIAKLFYEELHGEFKYRFKEVIFAIHSRNQNYQEFETKFTNTQSN